MYESHFGLKLPPFKITPDPTFICWSPAHINALNILRFGLFELAPITVVTGEIGVGKTTVLLKFLEETPQDLTIALISNFTSGSGNLYSWVLNAFGLDSNGTPIQLFRRLQDFLLAEYAAERRGFVIVDEAQNISDDDLEQLRMLTNINNGKDVLVVLCLVGQPQLRDRLMQPQNRQIAQRVVGAFHLGSMEMEETRNYVRYRLSVAGAVDEIFDDRALDMIHEATGGIPRVVNLLCNMALVSAFGDGIKTITGVKMALYLQDTKEHGYLAHVLPSEQPKPQPAAPVELPVKKEEPPEVPPLQRHLIRSGRQQIRLASDIDAAVSTHRDANTEQLATVAESSPELAPLLWAKGNAEETTERISGRLVPSELDPHLFPSRRGGEASSDGSGALAVSTEGPLVLVPPLTEAKGSPSRPGLWLGLACAAVGVAAVGYFVALPNYLAPTPSSEAAVASLDRTAAAVASEPAGPIAPFAVEPLVDRGGAELMDAALDAGVSDPTIAAVNYARAALRGEARAAYYLGQMYETGDGVPLNTALARAWYGFGTKPVRSASHRLADLQEPKRSGAIAAPVPLLGGPLPDGPAEFVWTSGNDVGPALYAVEVAADITAKVRRFPPQRTSAFMANDIGDAKVWRVIAFDRESGSYAVAEWHAMGAAPEPTVLISNRTVRPDIVIEAPETMSDDAVAEVAASLALPNAETSALKVAKPAPEESEVLFAFEEDRATALSLAERIGGGANVSQFGAAVLDTDAGMLPGQVIVRLAIP